MIQLINNLICKNGHFKTNQSQLRAIAYSKQLVLLRLFVLVVPNNMRDNILLLVNIVLHCGIIFQQAPKSYL